MITCGIDPSRSNLCVSIVEDMRELDYFEISNDAKGHQEILSRLRKLDTLPDVFIEGHGDFAKRFAMYLKKQSVRVYEINPLKARRFKESITWDKSDHIDARIAALMPFQDTNPVQIEGNPKIEGLKRLTREYETMSKVLTSYKNRFHSILFQNYGMIYKKIFAKLNETSLTFFLHFPSESKLCTASQAQIKKALAAAGKRYYLGENGVRKAKEIRKLFKDHGSFEEDIFTDVNSQLITTMGQALLVLIRQKEELKKVIGEYMKKYFSVYLEKLNEYFDAIGTVNISILIAEIGGINRFENDGRLASYAGQAPRNQQSSTVRKTARRRNYNRHLAKPIHLLALNNSRKGKVYFEYYELKKKKYAKKLRALKAVKRLICKDIFNIFSEIEKIELRKKEKVA